MLIDSHNFEHMSLEHWPNKDSNYRFHDGENNRNALLLCKLSNKAHLKFATGYAVITDFGIEKKAEINICFVNLSIEY